MELDILPQSKSSFSLKSPLSIFSTFRTKRKVNVPTSVRNSDKKLVSPDALTSDRRSSNVRDQQLPFIPENLKRGSLEMMFEPTQIGIASLQFVSPSSPQKGILLRKKEANSMPTLVLGAFDNKIAKENKIPSSKSTLKSPVSLGSGLDERFKNPVSPQGRRAKRVTFAIEAKNPDITEELEAITSFRRKQQTLKFEGSHDNQIFLFQHSEKEGPRFSLQGSPRKEGGSSMLPSIEPAYRSQRGSLLSSPRTPFCPIKTNLLFERKPSVSIPVKKEEEKSPDEKDEFSLDISTEN